MVSILQLLNFVKREGILTIKYNVAVCLSFWNRKVIIIKRKELTE